jgi:hypothetical protein
MMLTNVTGDLSGRQLYIVGGDGSSYGTAGTQATSKVKLYSGLLQFNDRGFGRYDADQHHAPGQSGYTTETIANWPPDDWTDRAAANDYFTLVQWHMSPPGPIRCQHPHPGR